MPLNSINFDTFTFDKYFWEGNHAIPWLAADVEIMIDGDAGRIPDEQRSILAFIHDLPISTREKLQQYIYDEYQAEIYGAYSGGDDVTPPISTPNEIWALVSEPGVTVFDIAVPERYFVISFECVWDPEHGLSILFNDQGNPVDIGGQGDV